MELKDKMRKYAVEATSVEDFCRRFYKGDRFYNEAGFNFDREQRKIRMQTEDLAEDGYAMITAHDSRTGDTVTYFED